MPGMAAPTPMMAAQQGADITEADLALAEMKEVAFNSWSPGQTWFAWCSTTNTTVTMGDSTWLAWNNNVTSTTGSMALNYPTGQAYVSTGTQWISWNVQYTQETEDQRAEREAARAEANARYQEQYAERAREQAAAHLAREEAEKRALELLRSLLSDAQWASYQEKGWFEVRGSSGRRWRVRNRGQSGNVDLMPEIGEERDMTFCAHPPGSLPAADAHVAQMLALVTDDEAFERVANVHWRRPRDTDERREGRATADGRAHIGGEPWFETAAA